MHLYNYYTRLITTILFVFTGYTYGLKDGNAVLADIATRSEPQSPHESGTQVTQNVPVEVRHHQHIKLGRLLDQLDK